MLLLHLWVIVYQNRNADRCVEACHDILMLVRDDNQKVDLIPCDQAFATSGTFILHFLWKPGKGNYFQ
jgi:hypothetical protein